MPTDFIEKTIRFQNGVREALQLWRTAYKEQKWPLSLYHAITSVLLGKAGRGPEGLMSASLGEKLGQIRTDKDWTGAEERVWGIG